MTPEVVHCRYIKVSNDYSLSTIEGQVQKNKAKMKKLRKEAQRCRQDYDENFPIFPWKYTKEEKEQMLLKSRAVTFDMEKVERSIHDLEVLVTLVECYIV